MKKKNIVITGTNRGLGLFLAEKFIKEGNNIFLLSRNKKSSQKLKNVISELQNKIGSLEKILKEMNTVLENNKIEKSQGGILGIFK